MFPLSVSAPWPSWEVQHEGSFWGRHRGVACTSGRSIKLEQCWLSWWELWAVMYLGWVRHPIQMKSEGISSQHFTGQLELFTHNMEWQVCWLELILIRTSSNWNSCPLKELLGTSHTTPPLLVQLVYILNKDMARHSHSGYRKVGPSSFYPCHPMLLISSHGIPKGGSYGSAGFILFERFPERVRDYPTYTTLKTGIVDRSWERREIWITAGLMILSQCTLPKIWWCCCAGVLYEEIL